jgi:rhamnosyltransferase
MPDVGMQDIAAVVVLYRPNADVLANVRATAAQVDRVFAVDNTEEPDAGFIKALCTIPNLTHVPLGDNLGIATALNAGVEVARDSGHAWVLTMDQDSTPDEGMVAALARCAGGCAAGERVGILAPVLLEGGALQPEPRPACSEVLTAITSGNLLSVDAWTDAGGFDEGLFIDQVDHDMCLKLHRRGFSILECGEARLVHRLGEPAEVRLGRTYHVSNHSPLRRYYITRNRFEVARRYRDDFPGFGRSAMRALRHELVKIVLWEDRKTAKLLMSWRGYRDYRRGITGPFKG